MCQTVRCYRACGLTEEEMNKPIIGIVSRIQRNHPSHINLDKIRMPPRRASVSRWQHLYSFRRSVCDGIAMGHIGMKYSLPSRELIADSVETLAQAHQFDALVLIPNCDKIVPSMLMAAARSISVYHCIRRADARRPLQQGGDFTLKTFETVGAYKAGLIDDNSWNASAAHARAAAHAGHVHGQLDELPVEAIGMALPGNGTIPAVHAARIHLAKHAGMQVMELLRRDIKPRDILTPAAFPQCADL